MQTPRLLTLVALTLAACAVGFAYPASAEVVECYSVPLYPGTTEIPATVSVGETINFTTIWQGHGYETSFVRVRIQDMDDDADAGTVIGKGPCTSRGFTFPGADHCNTGVYPITITEGSATTTWYVSLLEFDNAECSGSPYKFWYLPTPATITIGGSGTSTWDISDAVSAAMPTYGWEHSTTTGNGSSTSAIAATVASKVFSGDTEHFPGCFLNPILGIADVLNGLTNGTADPQAFVISGGAFLTSPIVLEGQDSTPYAGLSSVQVLAAGVGTLLLVIGWLLWVVTVCIVIFDIRVMGTREVEE